jgi:hypothetical protein
VRAASELHALLEASVTGAARYDTVELEALWRKRHGDTHAP